jgi:hypothetical protein
MASIKVGGAKKQSGSGFHPAHGGRQTRQAIFDAALEEELEEFDANLRNPRKGKIRDAQK